MRSNAHPKENCQSVQYSCIVILVSCFLSQMNFCLCQDIAEASLGNLDVESGTELTSVDLTAQAVELQQKAKLNLSSTEDRETVKTIMLVGNGRSILGKRRGALVDTYDLVGRYNFFRTSGFEKDVGRRTDLWFLNQLKIPGKAGFIGNNRRGQTSSRFDTSIKPLKYVIPIVYAKPEDCTMKALHKCGPFGPKDERKRNRTATMLSKIYEDAQLEAPVEIMPVTIEQALQQKYHMLSVYPSTGAMSIAYCLENFPNATITVMGFDFLGGTLGHYWEKFLKTRTVHNTKGEAVWMRGLAKGNGKRLVIL